jgi:CheY-like chemotaxis protein
MADGIMTECATDVDVLEDAHKQFLAAIERLQGNRAPAQPPAAEADERLLRVLIVDDHRATTDTLFLLAVGWGHDVRRAYDGATGLILANGFQPDVLLLDMLMPGVDGFEVVIRVRENERLKHCFMIAVSGRTDAQHRTKCYAAGIDLFLTKPVFPTDLHTLLTLEFDRLGQQRPTVTSANLIGV